MTILFSGVWRANDPRLTPQPRQREYVPLLGVCAFTSFIGSLLAQMIYIWLRRPPVDIVSGKLGLSGRDLAVLGLMANLIGWAVGVSLIRSARAVPIVGYQIKRFAAGVRDGAVGIFIAMPVVFITLCTTQWVWLRVEKEEPAKHELLKVMEETHSGWIRVGVVLAAVVAAPLFEELLFRGLIQGALRRLTGRRWLAIGVASILFALLHDLWTMPPIFVLSLFLGFAYERKGNLWTSTVMHALFNAFNLITSSYFQ